MKTDEIDHTKICAIAQSTDVELELERLVALVNKIPALEQRIEQLEEDRCCCDRATNKQAIDFVNKLEKHTSFRNGTMIVERVKLE